MWLSQQAKMRSNVSSTPGAVDGIRCTITHYHIPRLSKTPRVEKPKFGGPQLMNQSEACEIPPIEIQVQLKKQLV